MRRNPPTCGKRSGCMAAAKACSPETNVEAGVFKNSSRMQYTRLFFAAGRFSQSRQRMIFSSGTRSSTPHHAAIITSGRNSSTSANEICFPGFPTNSPPAASTNSATQACEAISGLPHSSQNTRSLDKSFVRERTESISLRIFSITRSPSPLAFITPAMTAMSA